MAWFKSKGPGEGELRSADALKVVRAGNGMQYGSTINFGPNVRKPGNPDEINLARLDDYMAALKKPASQGGASFDATVKDFNKLYNDFNLVNKESNTASIENMGSNLDFASLAQGYNSGSVIKQTGVKFLEQMQTIFENRKAEILARYQRPGAQAQTGV